MSYTKRFIIVAVVFVLVAAVAAYIASNDFSRPGSDDGEGEDLSRFFAWQIYDDSLDTEARERFYQLFLASRFALEKNSDLFSGWLDLGKAKHAVGDYEGARDAWEHLSEIRPENSLSFGNLAALYTYDLFDAEKADQNYRIAIKNSLGEPFNINYYRNYFEFQLYFQEDKKMAEDVLLAGIKDNSEEGSPGVVDLYTLLAGFYVDEGRVNEAIEYYDRSLDINPDNQAVLVEIERLKEL